MDDFPAFPSPKVFVPKTLAGGEVLGGQKGMSVRDYFAAHAPEVYCCRFVDVALSLPEQRRQYALAAYAHADAMLTAR